jgi:transposase
LAWEEYRQVHPEGYGYSRFCELYGRWLRKLDVVLRQKRGPGEKDFVDWAGKTIPIQDSQTGEIRGATLFVMVLGASSYTYAEATLDQQMAVWLRCHIHAFEYFQGVPRLLVPENTRTAVSRACRYENVERAAMLPLPAEPFDMSQWLLRTSKHRLPHRLRSQLLQRVIPPDWRTGRSSTPTTVEIFHKGKSVASHPRGRGREQAITQNEHRPKSHQAHLEWTPKRMVHRAEQIGPNTARLIERILSEKPHPEMGYRSCLGIIRLVNSRLNAETVHVGTMSNLSDFPTYNPKTYRPLESYFGDAPRTTDMEYHLTARNRCYGGLIV